MSLSRAVNDLRLLANIDVSNSVYNYYKKYDAKPSIKRDRDNIVYGDWFIALVCFVEPKNSYVTKKRQYTKLCILLFTWKRYVRKK